jgi:hypothetical protein
MAKKPKDMFEGRENQGEGSKTAARDYNERATEHARKGDVSKEAQHAREALEGTESQDLRDAETEGKKRAKEEDPEIRRG